MRYFIAFLCPPLAVLLSGKLFGCLVNCILTLCFYFPGLIHALLVVNGQIAEERQGRLIRAMGGTYKNDKIFRLK